MNKNETKYLNTARLMNEALLILLEKKNYEFITVKEICKKAGVNRSTFYLHYETMDDLLEETIDYITSKMYSKFHEGLSIDKNKITSAPLDELVLIKLEYLTPYLEFVRDNKKVFNVAVSQPTVLRFPQIFDSLYAEVFSPILSRYGVPDADKKYLMSFYLNGIYSVIMAWIGNACKDDIAHIAELLINFVHPSDR